MSKQFLTLDGDAGGGQILRNGFSLAALLQQPVEIINIRGGRNPPGLRPQHLAGIKLVNDMCQGTLEGATDNSTRVAFLPREFRGGLFTVDTKTAGSCTLLAQIAIPCLLFAPLPSTLIARGGTDVNWSPPIDEMIFVLTFLLQQFGINYDIKLNNRGFFPAGGGEIEISVYETCQGLHAITMLEQGDILAIRGRAFAIGLKETQELGHVVDAAIEVLKNRFPGVPIDITRVFEQKAQGNGCGITLIAETNTGCVLGATHFRDPKKRMTPIQCGQDAANKLIKEIEAGGCVDQYTQDQLLIFMALAQGHSELKVGEITEHSKLCMEMIQQMTPCKFFVKTEGITNVISIEGLGLKAPGRWEMRSPPPAPKEKAGDIPEDPSLAGDWVPPADFTPVSSSRLPNFLLPDALRGEWQPEPKRPKFEHVEKKFAGLQPIQMNPKPKPAPKPTPKPTPTPKPASSTPPTSPTSPPPPPRSASPPITKDEAQKLPVREIIAKLNRRGVNYDGIYEKPDLIALLMSSQKK